MALSSGAPNQSAMPTSYTGPLPEKVLAALARLYDRALTDYDKATNRDGSKKEPSCDGVKAKAHDGTEKRKQTNGVI
jgi:hypothetical protein